MVGRPHKALDPHRHQSQGGGFPPSEARPTEDNPGSGVNSTREQQNPNPQGVRERARTQGPAQRCPTKERPPSPMNNQRRASEHDREHTCNHPNPEERSSRKKKEDNREAVEPTKVNLKTTHCRIWEHNGKQQYARNHGPATND